MTGMRSILHSRKGGEARRENNSNPGGTNENQVYILDVRAANMYNELIFSSVTLARADADWRRPALALKLAYGRM